MLQFWFEMGGDGTKRYRKMKRRRRAHIGSMGSKCDTARRCDDVGQGRGGIGEKERRKCKLD
jgi:hypothetical protein